ncbi:MAG: hypothetical protein HOQ09_13800, partial [Gemmatimonadaceae bacterium]|nr:hypothetical protein [Gemmatimonadaceae bacterium]
MRRRLLRPRALAVLVALTAAGARALPAQQPSAREQAEMKEMMSYRLTEAIFGKLIKVQDDV